MSSFINLLVMEITMTKEEILDNIELYNSMLDEVKICKENWDDIVNNILPKLFVELEKIEANLD